MRSTVETVGIPGISVSETALAIAEGGTDEYQVILKARPIANVTVNVGFSEEVTASIKRLTFAPPDWNTPQTLTLTAGQDRDSVDDTLDVTQKSPPAIRNTRGLRCLRCR